MSEPTTPMNYINLILQFLKGNSNINSAFNKGMLSEYELDLSSKDLFKQIFNNMIYFHIHNENHKIESEEQKYFYISNQRIIDVVNKFEFKIIQTIDTLINKYIMDFQQKIDFSNIKNTFNNKINYLVRYMQKLPLY